MVLRLHANINSILITSHFREARKSAYTIKNIQAVFECTSIVPFNPCRVLTCYTGTAAANPTKAKFTHLASPSQATLRVPTTPSNNRAVRHLRQQALSQVEDPILRTLIDKLANAAIGGLTRGFLGEDRATQLEAALAVKVDESKNTRKRTTLTKAKAVTGEELLRLQVEKLPQVPKARPQKKKVTFRQTQSNKDSPESDSNGSFISFSDSDDLDTCSEGSTIYVRTPGGAERAEGLKAPICPILTPTPPARGPLAPSRVPGSSRSDGPVRRSLRKASRS